MGIDIGPGGSLWELIDGRGRATPDGVLAVDEAGRSICFGDYREQVVRCAAGLHELGVRSGQVVSWILPTWIEATVVTGALDRIGATQNAILPSYRFREVSFIARQAGTDWLLVPTEWRGLGYLDLANEVADAVAGAGGRDLQVVVVDRGEPLPDADPATLAPSPDDPARIAWIMYTSGTTSDPKGAQHTDQTLIAGGLGMALALDMGPDDVGSIAFPYAHIGGPNYIVTMMVNGFPAVLLERFSITEAIEVFRRHGVTMAGGSTAFYTMFLAEHRKNPDEVLIPTLRMLSGGGAPKPPEVYFEVAAEMGIPVCHGYGMTECPMICQGGPDDSPDQLAHTEGHPVHGCEVSIVDADGNPVPPGTEGEVRVAGPMVFKGYRNAALNTEAFDAEGRFRTGDLGVRREDGHVTLTGRLKDVIIRKGENISAKEIEDLLYTHPKVADVAVIGLADPSTGERCCAVVVPTDPAQPLGFAEMQDHCRGAGLMTQKIPEQLEQVDALPRNPAGKVVKFELRDRFGAG